MATLSINTPHTPQAFSRRIEMKNKRTIIGMMAWLLAFALWA